MANQGDLICIRLVVPDVRNNAPKAAVKGHGLWSTMWKG